MPFRIVGVVGSNPIRSTRMKKSICICRWIFSFWASRPLAAPPFDDSNARGRQSRPCAILRRLWRLRIYGALAPPARRPVGRYLRKDTPNAENIGFDRPVQKRRTSALQMSFFFPAQIPRKWRSLFTSPLLISRRNPERSRWRLCRLTDAAGPLRVLRWIAVWVRRCVAVFSAIKEYRF